MIHEFSGMSSDTAMKKYAGGVAEYRSSEGKTVEVSQELTSLPLLTVGAGRLQGPCGKDHPRPSRGSTLGVYLCEGDGGARKRGEERTMSLLQWRSPNIPQI